MWYWFVVVEAYLLMFGSLVFIAKVAVFIVVGFVVGCEEELCPIIRQSPTRLII